MPQSTNTSVINFCDVCNLSFESKKGLYRHQSYDLKHRELMEKRLKSEEEEILERVYNSDEDNYIIKTRAKAETKTKTDIIKTETESGIDIAKTEPCWVSGYKFKNQIGLQTHMNKHMRESVISTDPIFANQGTCLADNYILNQALIKDSYILLSRVVILMILMSL